MQNVFDHHRCYSLFQSAFSIPVISLPSETSYEEV